MAECPAALAAGENRVRKDSSSRTSSFQKDGCEMRALRSILIAVMHFSTTGYAMEPQPPKELNLTIGSFVVQSIPGSGRVADKTLVYAGSNLKKKLLWEVDTYVGEKRVKLAKDGQTMVVFGNVYFGDTISDDSNAVILSVYEKGKQPREFSYLQITSHDIKADIEKHGLLVLGGGWVSVDPILQFKEVAWEKRQVVFEFNNAPLMVSF
jgi:hypothetical protein